MEAHDAFRVDTRQRSLHYIDIWLRSFYWITFLMTFAGAALPLSRLDVLTRHPEFAGAVIVLVQIALVGCIYYPCAVMFTWVRRIPISEAQSFCAAGSVGIGALFGVWLEKTTGTINTPTIISILIAAPSLASLMLGVHILRRNKN